MARRAQSGMKRERAFLYVSLVIYFVIFNVWRHDHICTSIIQLTFDHLTWRSKQLLLLFVFTIIQRCTLSNIRPDFLRSSEIVCRKMCSCRSRWVFNFKLGKCAKFEGITWSTRWCSFIGHVKWKLNNRTMERPEKRPGTSGLFFRTSS